MTTIAELKRDEQKRSAFLLDALEAANTLDKAEQDMKGFVKNFRNLSSNLTEVTGMELWHSDDGDRDVWFWRTYYKPTNSDNESVEYPTRSAAIRALIDGTIEWK